MAVTAEKRLEMLERLVAELIARNDHSPVLVEGRRDREALAALGLHGEVLHLNVGRNLADRISGLAARYDGIIILTDWDDKGRTLFNRLGKLARAEGLRVEEKFWRELMPLVQKDIRSVEDLHMLVEQLRRKSRLPDPPGV